jgi:hypothetical protein
VVVVTDIGLVGVCENVNVRLDIDERVTEHVLVNVVGDRVNVTVASDCRTRTFIVDSPLPVAVVANMRIVPNANRRFINIPNIHQNDSNPDYGIPKCYKVIDLNSIGWR